MSKISIKSIAIQGRSGYDIEIMDKDAVLQDLLDEVNRYIAEGSPRRLWPAAKLSSCYGCDLCCYEAIPLTSVDVISLCSLKRISLVQAYKYLWVEARDKVIDITLRRNREGRCIFLQSDATCSIYAGRPFVCQTYLCCPTTSQVEELRSQVVNMGMDELIRITMDAFAFRGKALPLNRSRNARIDRRDWGKNSFTGKKDYAGIRIKNVLSSDLFKHMLL